MKRNWNPRQTAGRRGRVYPTSHSAKSRIRFSWHPGQTGLHLQEMVELDSSERYLAGYQLMVSSEVLRGCYRRSFEKPEPIPPNTTLDYSFSLHTQNYSFLKGHRVMVQVQSTWFPIIDRNPQTLVPNIFEARAGDFHTATHRIYRSARYPSHVSIQVKSVPG